MISRMRVPAGTSTLLLAAAALVFQAGCGGDSAATPVEGVVTLNGKPLPDATVVLLPTKGSGPGPFSGKTDSEGRFMLGTALEPEGGAVPGQYRMKITTVENVAGEEGKPAPMPTQKEVVPPDYRDGRMPFEVPAGGARDIKVELTAK